MIKNPIAVIEHNGIKYDVEFKAYQEHDGERLNNEIKIISIYAEADQLQLEMIKQLETKIALTENE